MSRPEELGPIEQWKYLADLTEELGGERPEMNEPPIIFLPKLIKALQVGIGLKKKEEGTND